MNMTNALNMFSNPQQFAMQQMMKQMITENPQQWKQAQQMFNGKNKDESMQLLSDMYSKAGMNLQQVASQWGISI